MVEVATSHLHCVVVLATNSAMPSPSTLTFNRAFNGQVSPRLAGNTMETKGSGSVYSSLNACQDDLVLNICRLADFVAVGISNNREMDSDVKQLVSNMRHVSYQTIYDDSRIDDHDKDLRELMGTVDCIKEDL